MRTRVTSYVLALFLILGSSRCFPARAEAPTIAPGPGYDPVDFRVTTFATGLHFPTSMQQLSDGSLLVATSNPTGGNFFSSTGELLRFVDANGDGVADGPPTVLYTGLPGGVTSVRIAGSLVFATCTQFDSESILCLRMGAQPSDPFSLVGSINFNFPNGWEHLSYALAVRPTPGQPGKYDLFFNIGSRANSTLTTTTVGVSGLITGIANGDAIHKVTVQDLGSSVSVTGLTQIARGLRNAAGMAFHPITGDLYFEDNGIDGLVNRAEPLSADELNAIPAANIGGAVEDFGFPSDYIEYRTGNRIGSGGIQPLAAFQPLPDPQTGSESEGPVEIAFAPPTFPSSLQNGLFIGFHGQFSRFGIANEENPLVHVNPSTGAYFHFIGNDEPNVGHLNGLLATAESLFVADWSTTGSFDSDDFGAIYQIKYFPPITRTTAASRSGFVGSSVQLPALLRAHGIGVPNKTLTFKIEGSTIGTAVTNGAGLATLDWIIPVSLGTGSKALEVVFAGDTDLKPSSDTRTLTVRYNTRLTLANALGALGKTTQLRASLRRAPDGAFVTGKTVLFKVNGETVGSAVIGADNLARLNYILPASLGAGSHALTAEFAGDSDYVPASANGTLTAHYDTKVTLANALGALGKTTQLRASLRRAPDGAFVTGKTVLFKVNGETVGSAVIGADNLARLNYILPASLGAGSHALTAEFAGDGDYAPALANGTLTARYDTKVTVANITGQTGQTVQLRAALRRYPDGAFVTGKTIIFKIDGETVGMAVIGADNLARLNFSIPAAYGSGVRTITAEFAGDSDYNASLASGTLTTSAP